MAGYALDAELLFHCQIAEITKTPTYICVRGRLSNIGKWFSKKQEIMYNLRLTSAKVYSDTMFVSLLYTNQDFKIILLPA